MAWNKGWFQLSILLLLGFIWGSSFILIKMGLRSFSSEQVATLRMLSAGVVLWPLAFQHLKNKSRADLIFLGLSGMFGGLIPALLFAKAQTRIDSSLAGMLNAMTPVFTFIVGLLLFKMRTHWQQGIGMLLGMIGALGLMAVGTTISVRNVDPYSLLIMLATLCYATNVNLVKARLTHLRGVEITSLSFFFVSPIAIVYFLSTSLSGITHTESWPLDLFAILLLGIIGTALAMLFMNSLIRYTSAIFASTVTYIIPAFAIGWGMLDGEKVSALHVGFMVCILLGVYVINRKPIKMKR